MWQEGLLVHEGIMMHSGTHRGRSQKFKIPAQSKLNPSTWLRLVWPRRLVEQHLLSGARLCGTMECLGWGENLRA